MPYKKYSPKQKKLAAVAGDPKKIEAVDLKSTCKETNQKESVMPYGKGTYGSKVGRPSKADKMNPTLKENGYEKNEGEKEKDRLKSRS